MVTRDIANNINVSQIVAPELRTGDVTSTEIDTQGAEALAIVIGVGTWTDGTFTFEVQESDTSGSGHTAVAAANLDGTEPVIDAADEDETLHKIGYQGSKRYIQLVCTVTDSPGTGVDWAAYAIKGELHNKPAD